MKNKKFIIIGISVIVIICLILIFVNPFSGKSNGNEDKLNANLNQLGKDFYEGYYYPSQEKSQTDVKKFLERFEKNGIKINLQNLAKISSIDKELIESMVNSKTNEKCDFEKTTVTIYPKTPYGKTDYELKVNLDCGFDVKKDDKK